jgi:glycosyltransferase involved in cell wall biosynthesis
VNWAFRSVGSAARAGDSLPGDRALSVLVAHPSPDLYGSDRVLLESVKALIAGGMSVTVALPTAGPLVAEVEDTGATVAICPTPVLRKSILRPTGFALFSVQVAKGMAGGLRVMKSCNPDAVYVNTVTIPLWSILAKLFGKPVLTHVHEAEGSAPAVLRFLLAAPLLLSTSIVANSAYSASVLTKAVRGLSSRTVIVYNGVPGPNRPEAPRTVITRSVRLLYVGRLSSRKGVDVAVNALRQIRQRGIDASLDIVGAVFPGYEWYETELRELVDGLGLTDAVTFHGFIPDVWPNMARADIVLVPSRLDEPFGNTAVEALLAGRPVIVSDTSGLREAAGSYPSAQLVPPGDPAALAEAVERVVDNWASYQEHAQADAATAFTRHSPDAYGARIRDELKAVVR